MLLSKVYQLRDYLKIKMTPEQENKLNQLFTWFQQMQKSSSIPLSTDQAIRARLGIGSAVLKRSTIASTTYDQAVNEGGLATYAVFDTPDGFVEYIDNGQILYIPFRT